MVRPGERVPLDGVVLSGNSSLDTTALTGESAPREVAPGGRGAVAAASTSTGLLRSSRSRKRVRRIHRGQNSATWWRTPACKKARAENFITKFARYYTPAVVHLRACCWR